MTLAKRLAVLVLGFLLVSPANAQVLARGRLAGAEDARAYADALAQLRARRLSVAWNGLSLAEAVKDLRVRLGRAILFTAEAADRKESPITLELTDVAAASLVRVVESSAKVRFLFEGGIVFVTTPEDAVRRSLVMRVYDVSDLLYRAPDFPAPFMGLHPGRPAEAPEESPAERRDASEIIDLMRTLVGPDAWDVPGTAIAFSGRLLVVTQTPEVHAKIRHFISALAALL
jgi:hypothetical protein